MKLRSVFLTLVTGLMTLFVSAAAFANEAAGAASGGKDSFFGAAAALGLGLAALGGALGQGRVAAAALDGIGRNPAAAGKIFTPMIVGLALIESLVLYAFVVAFVKA